MTLVQRLVGLVALVLMPLAAVQGYNAARLEDEREEQVARDATRLISAIRSEEARFVEGLRDTLAAAGRDAPDALSSRDDCDVLLARGIGPRAPWLVLSVADAAGIVRCSADRGLVGVDLSSHPEVAEAMRGVGLAIGDVQAGGFVDRPHLPVALGWRRGVAKGAIIASLDIGLLGENFSAGPLPADAALAIADRSGRVLAVAPSGRGSVGEILPPRILHLVGLDRPGTARARWLDGTDSVVGYAPLGTTALRGVSLVVGISRTEAMEPLRDASRRATATFAVTLLAATLLAWWCGVVLVRRPLRILAEAAARMRRGERGTRANLGGRTELAALGSEFDRMAEAIEAGERRAEQADVEKTRFLASASHDLRQPLQGALMFADAVASLAPGTPGSVEALGKLTRALDDMRQLVDSLMDVSRIDAGVVEPTRRDVPIRQLMEQIVATSVAAAEAKGLVLSAVGPDATVRSDPVVLGRILRNLVENAVRYTEAGSVVIGWSRFEAQVRIEVTDTGPGIAADDIERIWNEFHQLHRNPGRDRRAGLGLGLSIVRRLARLLDHPITVRSVVGTGTVFAIDVPLVASRSAATEAPAPCHETTVRRSAMGAASPPGTEEGNGPSIGEGAVILVVEDDPVILGGLSQALAANGYGILAASGVREAVELAGRGPAPDAIVADFRLAAGETGADAVMAVREVLGREVGGIILTGEQGPDPAEAAARLGLGLLRKPATLRQIVEAIRLRTGDRHRPENTRPA